MTIDKLVAKNFYKQFIKNKDLNIDDILKIYVFEGFLANINMNAEEYYKYKLIKFKYLLKNKILEMSNTNNNYYKRFNKKDTIYNVEISKPKDKTQNLTISIESTKIINSLNSININNKPTLNENLVHVYNKNFIEQAKKNIVYLSNNDNILEILEELYSKYDSDELGKDIDFENDNNFIEDYDSDDSSIDYDEYSCYSDSDNESECDNDILGNYQKNIEDKVYTCNFNINLKIEKKYLDKNFYKAYYEYLHIFYNTSNLYCKNMSFNARTNYKYIIINLTFEFNFGNNDYIWTNIFNFNKYSQRRKANLENNNIIKKNISYINERIINKILVLL
jgi:hypothetical protein